MRKIALKSTQTTTVGIADLADTIMDLSDFDFAELFLEIGNRYSNLSQEKRDNLAEGLSPKHGSNRKDWLFDLTKAINHFEFLDNH